MWKRTGAPLPNFANVAQLVESLPSKQIVAGSNPVVRSTFDDAVTLPYTGLERANHQAT